MEMNRCSLQNQVEISKQWCSTTGVGMYVLTLVSFQSTVKLLDQLFYWPKKSNNVSNNPYKNNSLL
jgi:hypothetical protein